MQGNDDGLSADRTVQIRIETLPGRLEEALLSIAAPVLREARENVGVRAAFFARYLDEALLFFRGDPESIERIERDVASRIATGSGTLPAVGSRSVAYEPELDRYGGDEGVRLAERLFEVDSAGCLGMIALDDRGALGRSRREIALVVAERMLDALSFDRDRKIEFYRHGYAWAIDQGRWDPSDLRVLEERYRALREALGGLVRSGDDEAFGGHDAASVGREWIGAMIPLLSEIEEARGTGRLRRELVPLLGSYTHLQCIRLGIPGEAEAILRYFMRRVHEDDGGPP